jgi:ADP-ribose pyrophosphatase YjhB (NUDIX family)
MTVISAFAIIKNKKGDILLCHRRDRDLWNLPGGRVEVGESPWAAVLREVKEEVGLQVRVIHLAGIYAKPNHDELSFSFSCEITGGNLTETDEADAIEYFNINNFPPNTSERQVERVKDEIAQPNVVILKKQDVAFGQVEPVSFSNTVCILHPVD